MIDIIFIILVFFIFLIGVNKYENFESDTTLYMDLNQSSLIKTITGLLDGLTTDIVDEVKTIKGKFTGAIDEIAATKNWIESCVGCFKFCGKEPYWAEDGCTKEVCVGDKCVNEDYDCIKLRDKCGDPLPKWDCKVFPSGFSTPSAPSDWEDVFKSNC